MSRTRGALAAFAAAAAGSAVGLLAMAEQVQESGPGAGRVLYQNYCASCHGVSGEGNGPVAPELRTLPADLTRLSERYGYPLPKDALADFVDGRRDVAAHGPRDMPVWGERFFEGQPEDTPNLEQAKRRTIYVILEYIESIQRLRGT